MWGGEAALDVRGTTHTCWNADESFSDDLLWTLATLLRKSVDDSLELVAECSACVRGQDIVESMHREFDLPVLSKIRQ